MAQKTLIELEQLRNSRFYDDTKTLGPAAESGVTFSDDLDYVLSQLKQLHGETNWYDDPDASLAELSAMSGTLHNIISATETDIAELQAMSGTLHNLISTVESDLDAAEVDITEINTFIGRADGESYPIYSSINYVTQSGSLEQAIGELDAQVNTNATNIAVNTANIAALSGSINAAEQDIIDLRAFVGAADGDTYPTYSNTAYVTQSGSLEQAIGELDAAIAGIGVSGTWTVHYDAGNGILDMTNNDADIRMPSGRTWEFNDAAGANPIAEFIYGGSVADSQIWLRSLGAREYEVLAGVRAANTTFSIPGGASYTQDTDGRNLRVYRNGQLLLPGAGNDYVEVSATQIQNLDTWRPNEVIQYVILG